MCEATFLKHQTPVPHEDGNPSHKHGWIQTRTLKGVLAVLKLIKDGADTKGTLNSAWWSFCSQCYWLFYPNPLLNNVCSCFCLLWCAYREIIFVLVFSQLLYFILHVKQKSATQQNKGKQHLSAKYANKSPEAQRTEVLLKIRAGFNCSCMCLCACVCVFYDTLHKYLPYPTKWGCWCGFKTSQYEGWNNVLVVSGSWRETCLDK